MKKILILYLILISINVQSQTVKKVKNKISKNEKELYYVLSSDEETKHGRYEYYKSRQLIEEGNYKNGEKDGLWITYLWDGSKSSEGYYKKGLKNGHWIYYGYKEVKLREGEIRNDNRVGIWKLYAKGILVQEFDFDNDKIIVIDNELAKSYKSIFGGKYDGLIMVDENPSYIDGGPEGLHKFILDNIFYPKELEEKGISGKVLVSAILNIDGSLSDFIVKKGLDPIVDNQLIEVLRLTEGKWNLAKFNNEKVSSRVGISVVFGKI